MTRVPPTVAQLDEAYWKRRALELQYNGPIPPNAEASPSIVAALKADHEQRAQERGAALAAQIIDKLGA